MSRCLASGRQQALQFVEHHRRGNGVKQRVDGRIDGDDADGKPCEHGAIGIVKVIGERQKQDDDNGKPTHEVGDDQEHHSLRHCLLPLHAFRARHLTGFANGDEHPRVSHGHVDRHDEVEDAE